MQTTMNRMSRAGVSARPVAASRTRVVCRAEDKAVTKVSLPIVSNDDHGRMWPIAPEVESPILNLLHLSAQSTRAPETLTFPTLASESSLTYLDGSLPGE